MEAIQGILKEDIKTTEYSNKQNLMLFKELREISAQMAYTETWFQMEEDADLIESCIYQRESLKARYRYLIKKAKNNNLKFSPFSSCG